MGKTVAGPARGSEDVGQCQHTTCAHTQTDRLAQAGVTVPSPLLPARAPQSPPCGLRGAPLEPRWGRDSGTAPVWATRPVPHGDEAAASRGTRARGRGEGLRSEGRGRHSLWGPRAGPTRTEGTAAARPSRRLVWGWGAVDGGGSGGGGRGAGAAGPEGTRRRKNEAFSPDGNRASPDICLRLLSLFRPRVWRFFCPCVSPAGHN